MNKVQNQPFHLSGSKGEEMVVILPLLTAEGFFCIFEIAHVCKTSSSGWVYLDLLEL